jgi:TRAP-type C4-dicarboxylate transport system permease small subunit
MTMTETSAREAGPRAGLLVAAADGVDRAVGITCRLIVLSVGIVILLILSSNIVARYAMASGGLRFAQELPERLFPWFIMAGVVLAVQKGGHLAVEMLPDLLGRGTRRVLLLVGFAIVIASYAVLGYQAVMVAEMSWIDLSPILRMPVSYGYYALALGCAGIMLTTAAIAVRVAILGPEALPAADPEEQPT